MGIKPSQPLTMTLPSPLSSKFKTDLAKEIAKSWELLLCSDFDGTLVHFTGIPSETTLPPETEELLSRLGSLENLHLAIISGRGFRELTDLVPIENATLVGNHGLKTRFEDGTNHEPEILDDLSRAISALERDVRERFAGKDGIIIEDKGFGLALHYRQYTGDKNKIKKSFGDLWNSHSHSELELIEGAELMEIRPSTWDKGDAIRVLQERWGMLPTIYLGDDTTDEDAFRVLRNQDRGYPIIVSEETQPSTLASYRLKNPEEVRRFLEEIYKIFN